MRGMPFHVAEATRERIARAVAVSVLLAGTAALASPVVQGPELAKPAALQVLNDAVAADLARWPAEPKPLELVWHGADVDRDGAADFANPTGQETRGHDAYGEGEFGASRDGGSRRHEGVDFKADAGQPVVAPISGYVTKIGQAYAGDSRLKFVEITNPALRYAARVFYVSPSVNVGEPVHVGDAIGKVRTLQDKYPAGMTDHVHLEIMKQGRRIDASDVITARYERGSSGRG